jgi:hypothetical protein
MGRDLPRSPVVTGRTRATRRGRVGRDRSVGNGHRRHRGGDRADGGHGEEDRAPVGPGGLLDDAAERESGARRGPLEGRDDAERAGQARSRTALAHNRDPQRGGGEAVGRDDTAGQKDRDVRREGADERPGRQSAMEITISRRSPRTAPRAGISALLTVPTITVAIVIQSSAARDAPSVAPIWPSSVNTIR